MGKPKAPAPPDYAAAATAQGKANVDSSLATNFLNQANQVGPTGSLTYSYDYNNGYTLPDGTKIPQTTATTVLSPEQQKLYDQNIGLSTQLNDLAAKGMNYVGDTATKPIDTSKLPSLTGGLAVPGAVTTNLGIQGGAVSNVASPTNYTSSVATSPYASSFDFSKVSAAPQVGDFAAQRDKITDAMMQRLQPYIDRDREALTNKLANQGIHTGSQAYGADMDTFQRGVNDQRIAALLAGDTEQQNLFQNANTLHQQGISEAIAQGQQGNTAAAGNFGQALTNAQLGNSVNDTLFSNGLANANLANSALALNNEAQNQEYNQKIGQEQTLFNQGLAAGQFGNSSRAQALQEEDYLKNQPLNMLNALRSGNQVTMPSFGNVSGGSQIAAAPIYQATADSYSAALQKYQADMQARSGLLGGLASLGGAAITKWSDRRLKKNIQKLGIMPNGLGLYSYDYTFGGPRQFGVMADEVAILAPEALGPIVDGYATVNYGAL